MTKVILYVFPFSIELPLTNLHFHITITMFLLQVQFPKIANRTELFMQLRKMYFGSVQQL